MPSRSAGLLPFRRRDGAIEVFLVHPGGPLWAKRDEGAWSIAKGLIGECEDPLAAARREMREETGHDVEGTFLELAPIRQKGGKVVIAWAVEADLDASSLRSNSFTMEWPPRSGRIEEFPEVDRAAWFPIDEARRRMLPAQAALLDQLLERLAAP